MEGEASLPKATMQKMVREALPPDIRVAGDAYDVIVECCTEFVQLVSSEANDVSEREKKTTITPEHVLAALQQLGFAEFQEDLQAFYGDVKESNAQQGLQRKGSRKTGAEKSGLSEEEQARGALTALRDIALQRKLFAEARARTSGLVAPAEAVVPAVLTAAHSEQS